MANWQQYWNNTGGSVVHGDFFQQVGRTVGGRAVATEQLDYIVDAILSAMKIGPGDLILDICCGNGLVTQQIARHCRCVVGLDFSEPLLTTAQMHFSASNIFYRQGSAKALPDDLLPPLEDASSQGFSRVTLVDALQYFEPEDILSMLGRLRALCRPGFTMFLGLVPDQERLWNFYNTEARKADYRQRMSRDGRDAIGNWWHRQALVDLARHAGFDCQIIDEPPGRYTAHYRFDALLTCRSLVPETLASPAIESTESRSISLNGERDSQAQLTKERQ